ncbi:MAG: helix-turn-helix domain-containing protein [Butyricicoccaceae bacterium]
MNFADRVYEHMDKHHMTQAAVARTANIPIKQFNDILKGRKLLREKHILPICYALGASPNELFGYCPEKRD